MRQHHIHHRLENCQKCEGLNVEKGAILEQQGDSLGHLLLAVHLTV